MINQTKHTPGPWTLLPARTLTNVKGPGGEQICQLPIGDPNARLIAAAPDLLETLIQAVTESGYSLSGPTDWRAAENGEPRWVCNARAAIAKAEGEG